MYAAKSSLFLKFDECIKQNHYFSVTLHGFSSLHPHPGSVIWCSNSHDETAAPCLILDRGVDFWSPNGRIFKCMQRNRHFFTKLTNISRKISTCLWKSMDSPAGTPIEDPRSDPRILSTNWPLHFWSLIGVSNSEVPKIEFFNVCSEIVPFLEHWRKYHAKSTLFHENPWILKLAPLSRIRDLTSNFSRRNGYSITHPW